MEDIPLPEYSKNFVVNFFQRIKVTYRRYLDASTPHVNYRWGSFAVLLVLFMTRILLAQGWYIICYGLGIYLLNLFLAFLQPKFDPSLQQELQDESVESGEHTAEFRPFIRRLPEFKFWYRGTIATVVSLLLTLTNLTDVPVFWPILLIYFIVLFLLTMRKQIQQMIKYRYIPFDLGKKKYGSK
ncbi:RER1 [Cyberlindnera jadinii]|uniref:Protein RER1 n=1 Tax=Cyberlindnera jadinii (strain ATCC 18201 / CBS 1600 / BCRC 20928 / JCM 3617 / NBRC 0987 / NRRL Y-1542) TaxID=983966 RepID=A0A0H5C2E9_CYBJN|nr:retrieval of early ER protein Rer1 [Cyberlindnera jadinii NRRL Y-1542]ODV72299.1 retrieval of early ER protein Rer1 [Cyberlindnera jadinii NRRL Y-1542]CEP21951.1 RER1 [Cyberlindnera jadinii]